jgi:hypothetical protein
MGKIISSTDFRNHPRWFTTLNYLWKKSRSLGPDPLLKKDELMAAAKQGCGLHDFGRDFWDEPLERLIHSLNYEANLHPIGLYISRKRIINLLGVRLRAEHWFKTYPEILEQEVLSPMVIVGLQRTGTTKLHRLLTADPDNRVLRSWEAINPAPFKLHMNGKDKRIKIAKTSEKALRYMTPGFFAIHPVEHSAPEEDILLLDVTFLSTTPEATTHVPSYSDWLEKTDQSHAYEYGSRLLRLLQWQQPGKRWVLKSPHHLEFLPLIEKHYGDPHFIWTHRDPNECIPSFLSMVSHSRSIFTDDVKVQRLTGHWVRKTAYMLEKGLAYRNEAEGRGTFTDILYTDLVKDPLAQLAKIYERYGGISEQLRERFLLADSENPQGKYGIHEYSLSDFGLAEKTLEQKNRAYYSLFNQLSSSRV